MELEGRRENLTMLQRTATMKLMKNYDYTKHMLPYLTSITALGGIFATFYSLRH